MNPAHVNRGATVRLFGVLLLFLGMLDNLLAWRGGYGPGNFPAMLLAAGIFLYALGAILRIRGGVS